MGVRADIARTPAFRQWVARSRIFFVATDLSDNTSTAEKVEARKRRLLFKSCALTSFKCLLKTMASIPSKSRKRTPTSILQHRRPHERSALDVAAAQYFSSVLSHPDTAREQLAKIEREDFPQLGARYVYDALVALVESSLPHDYVNLEIELESSGLKNDAGDMLVMIAGASKLSNVDSYIAQLKTARRERDVSEAAHQLQIDIGEDDLTPSAAAARFVAKIATAPDAEGQPSPYTDEANFQRFFAQWKEKLRFCHVWNTWMIWDGTRWKREQNGESGKCARKTAHKIYAEAASAIGDESAKLAQWAIRSAAAARVEAILKLAKYEPDLSVSPDQFDVDPLLLNLRNGTLDLRTGELRAHSREDWLTKRAPVVFDRAATAPTFERFVNDIFSGDRELVGYVQRLLGYSITGVVSERVMPICYGGGQNGKNTLLETVIAVLGDDYAIDIDIETLMLKRDRTPPHEIADLAGIRFAMTDEVQKGGRLAESLVKRLTGSRRIRACRKYENSFEFEAQFKLWMGTNWKPDIKDDSHAMWDRIRLIPFEVRFYEAEEEMPAGAKRADSALAKRLRAEASGVLNWLVQGCRDWQRSGLGSAQKVKDASKKYRSDMDSIGRFIGERCIVGAEYRVQSSRLLDAFNKWSGENVGRNHFRPMIEERGFKAKHTEHGQFFVGLALSVEESDDEQGRQG